jgi:hypothetical protein
VKTPSQREDRCRWPKVVSVLRRPPGRHPGQSACPRYAASEPATLLRARRAPSRATTNEGKVFPPPRLDGAAQPDRPRRKPDDRSREIGALHVPRRRPLRDPEQRHTLGESNQVFGSYQARVPGKTWRRYRRDRAATLAWFCPAGTSRTPGDVTPFFGRQFLSPRSAPFEAPGPASSENELAQVFTHLGLDGDLPIAAH